MLYSCIIEPLNYNLLINYQWIMVFYHNLKTPPKLHILLIFVNLTYLKLANLYMEKAWSPPVHLGKLSTRMGSVTQSE